MARLFAALDRAARENPIAMGALLIAIPAGATVGRALEFVGWL